jgi:hypothetical protein
MTDDKAPSFTGPAPSPKPTVEAGADLLVTMTISVSRDGIAASDVQTHDNSYSEVAVGLSAVRDEINRVFAERKNCPYYPKNSEDANRKIVRSTEATRKAMGATPTLAKVEAIKATPPAASAQKGLSDEQIIERAEVDGIATLETGWYRLTRGGLIEFARALLRESEER